MADHVPVIVEDECIACGACTEICPEVFTLKNPGNLLGQRRGKYRLQIGHDRFTRD